MRKLPFIIGLAALTAMMGAAQAKVLSVATNAQGSLGYRTGIAVAKVVSGKSDLIARTQPMSGSTTYIPMINRGEIDFGFSNAMESYYAYEGVATFKGRPHKNLRLIGMMFPLRTGIVVLTDTGLKSIYDLQKYKGKRITSKYTSLSIIEIFISGVLANGKVSYDDFKRVPVSGFAKGIFALGQGKTDISWISLGSGAGRKVNAQLRKRGGFIYLDMDPSPEAAARFKKIMPAAEIVLEKNTKMPGIFKPTHIVQIRYMMLTSAGMDEATVYQVTKTLARNQPDLAKSMGAFRRLKVNAMAPANQVPYHPGALRAYEELGIKVGG